MRHPKVTLLSLAVVFSIPTVAFAQAAATPAQPVAPTAQPAAPQPAAPSDPGAPPTAAPPGASATPPFAVAPEPIVIPPPPPPPTAAPAPDGSAAKKLAVGTAATFQPGLLIQAWFTGNFVSGGSFANTFRARRLEISAKGDIVPGLISYGAMFDPAKVLEFQDKVLPVANQIPAPTDPTMPETVTAKQPVGAISALQDLFITTKTPYADVSIGQFKIPVSYEGYNSASKLLFPERSLVARQYGDKRDLGLRIAKTFEFVGYSAGIFNGAGLNNLDTNRAKDLALRLEVYPVKGLLVGGVVYGSVGQRGQAGTRDRFEGDIRFESGPVLIQAEYIRAYDVATTAGVHGQGFYGAAAFTTPPGVQLAARVGRLDPNVDMADDHVMHYEGCVSYYLRANEAKLQLSYSRFDYQGKSDLNELILAAQISY